MAQFRTLIRTDLDRTVTQYRFGGKMFTQDNKANRIDVALYLKLNGHIGEELFGYSRYLNQVFYQSERWKKVRRGIILRDHGCDLGIADHEIFGTVYVHHMNPITLQQIRSDDPCLIDPEQLICVSRKTHEAITLGDESLLPQELIERKPNDTCPWRQ